MRIHGVELPRALIEAHAAGELVIFVGAGASMGPPSDLPNFTLLVETIRDESQLADVIGKVNRGVDFRPLDELLDQMADDHSVNVHERIAAIIARPGSRPNPTHAAIASIASVAPHVRIVTTNYDRHLSTSIDRDILEYLAPALPVGDDFEGLVYLHGSLTQDPRRLIATATDFGKAYLTDAWAARFLDRMFASNPVLFIGYSHNDTIMKYFARGLAGRSKPRYILTDEPDSPLWKQLRVEPITCTHEQLPILLEEWASYASRGLLAQREHVRSLVEKQEPSQIPDDISYLESIVSEVDTVKFFTQFARGTGWLRWMANREELRSLFSSQVVETPTAWPVATWFAENYVTEALSGVALELVAQFGGQLGPELAFAIGRRLAAADDPFAPYLRPWLLLVAKDLRGRHPNFLDFILAKSSLGENRMPAIFLFRHLTAPTLNLTRAVFGGPSDIVLLGDDYWLRRSWEQVFRPEIRRVAAELLSIAEAHLIEADRQLALIDESARRNPSDSRTAIEPHPADEYPGPLEFLIDVARDCLDALITVNDDQAHLYMEAWAESEVALLRRLAVHGTRRRGDIESNDKIAWVIRHSCVADRELEHEVGLLLEESFASASVERAEVVLGQISATADTDEYAARRAYRLLSRLRKVCPEVVGIPKAIDDLRADHPSLEGWIQAIQAPEPTPETSRLPTSPDELHRMVTDNLTELVEPLREYEAKASGDEAPRWSRFGELLSEAVQQHPGDGFILLDAVGEGNPELTKCVVRGWAFTDLDTDDARKVLLRLASLDLVPVLHYVAYMLAKPTHGGQTDWHSVPESRDLAKMCWDRVNPTPMQGGGSDVDLATFAINHDAGRLAEFWTTLISLDWNARGDAWDGLDPVVGQHLQAMLNADDGRSEAVEIVLAGNLRFLHGADPQWCEDNLLPRFDWSDQLRARRMWEGYLSGSTWTNALLSAGFLDALLDAVSHRGSLRSDRARRLLAEIAAAAMFADLAPSSWLPKFAAACSPDDRAEWAEQVTFRLRSLEPDAAELQWQRWISDYWSRRLEGVPLPLAGDEAAAMANWSLFLTDSMSDAIALAMRTAGGLHERALFIYDLTPPEGASRLTRAPEQIAALLAHLLRSTNEPFHGGYELPDVLLALESHGVSTEAINKIREQGVRLNIPGCV